MAGGGSCEFQSWFVESNCRTASSKRKAKLDREEELLVQTFLKSLKCSSQTSVWVFLGHRIER
jgi:hypothetical protein